MDTGGNSLPIREEEYPGGLIERSCGQEMATGQGLPTHIVEEYTVSMDFALQCDFLYMPPPQMSMLTDSTYLVNHASHLDCQVLKMWFRYNPILSCCKQYLFGSKFH